MSSRRSSVDLGSQNGSSVFQNQSDPVENSSDPVDIPLFQETNRQPIPDMPKPFNKMKKGRPSDATKKAPANRSSATMRNSIPLHNQNPMMGMSYNGERGLNKSYGSESKISALPPLAPSRQNKVSPMRARQEARNKKPARKAISERCSELLNSPWVTLTFGNEKQCREALEKERMDADAKVAASMPVKKAKGAKGSQALKKQVPKAGWLTAVRARPMHHVLKYHIIINKVLIILTTLALLVHVALLYPAKMLLENAAQQCV